MEEKNQLSYGLWPSQITPQNTGALLDLSEPAWTVNGDLLWREVNSSQGSILMAAADGG